jgi:hypothetical protein
MPEGSDIDPVAAWASGCINLDASDISGSWSLQKDEQAGVINFPYTCLFFKKRRRSSTGI